jgi:hypothetical protein
MCRAHPRGTRGVAVCHQKCATNSGGPLSNRTLDTVRMGAASVRQERRVRACSSAHDPRVSACSSDHTAILLTVFIVFGSLCFAVLLHPEELIGDRSAGPRSATCPLACLGGGPSLGCLRFLGGGCGPCSHVSAQGASLVAAVLFVAFLILATNFQTDLGLGTVSFPTAHTQCPHSPRYSGPSALFSPPWLTQCSHSPLPTVHSSHAGVRNVCFLLCCCGSVYV